MLDGVNPKVKLVLSTMNDQDIAYPLLDETLHLLENRPQRLTMRKLAAMAGVSEQWVYHLKEGTYDEIGYKKLCRVNKILKDEFSKLQHVSPYS